MCFAGTLIVGNSNVSSNSFEYDCQFDSLILDRSACN